VKNKSSKIYEVNTQQNKPPNNLSDATVNLSCLASKKKKKERKKERKKKSTPSYMVKKQQITKDQGKKS